MNEGDRGAAAIRFYDRSAAVIAPQYDSVTFDAVHPGLAAFLPKPPARILDVGAGSGRDAAAFLRLGHHVTAIEPASALREFGRAAAPDARWLDDRLPELATLRGSGEEFDFILCSAVLMSLPPLELEPSLTSMHGLLAAHGRLSLSLRDPRQEEVLLNRHNEEAVRAAACRSGLQLVDRREALDALGRGLRWRSYLFQRALTPARSDSSRSSDETNSR